MKREIMEFMEKLCVGFEFNKLTEGDKDYLHSMYLSIKYGVTCPKTMVAMDTAYPNRSNFKLFSSQDKMKSYMASSPKPVQSYGSHLLGGRKYWVVWNYEI